MLAETEANWKSLSDSYEKWQKNRKKSLWEVFMDWLRWRIGAVSVTIEMPDEDDISVVHLLDELLEMHLERKLK